MKIKILQKILFSLLFINIFSFAHASDSVGSIDAANKITRVCQDSACTTFGQINFKPTIIAGVNPVVINDTNITGHIWGDQIGWINLNPTGIAPSDVLKVNPTTGVVTGKAYSSVSGWINFSATGAGVTLVDNGSGSNFSGWAWVSGTYGGWMKFDCAAPATCIKTDWRIISMRGSTAPPVAPPVNPGSLIGNFNGIVNNRNNNASSTSINNNQNPKQNTNTQSNTQNSNQNTNIQNNTIDTDSEGRAVPQPVGEEIPFPNIPDTENKDGNSVPDFPVKEDEISAQPNNYREIFPFYKDAKSAESCIFCIVIRDTNDTVDASGNINIISDDKIIKYGFVPKALELPISANLVSAELPDVDATSIVVTAAAGYVIRRYIIIMLIRKLFTGGL